MAKSSKKYIIIEKKESLLRAFKWFVDANGNSVIIDFVVLVYDEHQSKESLSNVVKDLLKKLEYKNEPVKIIISSKQASSRYMRFPSQNMHEIKTMISFQVEKLLPYSAEEILSGFNVVEKQEGYSYISIIALRKVLVAGLIENLLSNDVVLDGVYFGSYGVAELLFNFEIPIDEERLVIYCDGSDVDIIAMKGTDICLFRRVKLSGDYELSIRRHISETHRLYIRQSNGGPIARVCILGSAKEVVKVEKAMKEYLPIPVESFNVQDCLHISNTIGIKGFAENLAPALSFMKMSIDSNLNLLPEELKAKKTFSESMRDMFLVLFVFVLVLLGVIGVNWKRLDKEKLLLASIKAEFSEAQQLSGGLPLMQQRLSSMQKKNSDSLFILNFFYLIYTSLPEGVIVESISYEDSQSSSFNLKGFSETSEQVFAYVEYMQSLDLFERDNIKVNYVTTKKVKGKDRVSFELLFIK